MTLSGIALAMRDDQGKSWMPACAGMTGDACHPVAHPPHFLVTKSKRRAGEVSTMPHTSRRHALAAALLGLGMLFSFVAPARAVIMTYTLTGNITGSLGATNFSNAPFTWTQTGDTSAPTTVAGGILPAIPAITSTIQIAALPVATPTVGFFTAFNDGGDAVGFVDTNAFQGLSFSAAALNGYNFLAIGPINVSFDQMIVPDIDQSSLALSDAPTNLVFTATEAGAIPEPASLALLATGLLGLGLRRRRG